MDDLDARLFRLLHGEGGALGMVMLAFTALGSGWVGLAVFPFLALPRTRRAAAVLAIAIALQSVVVFSLKHLVGRTRPWIALAIVPGRELPHDPSFPSGHATASFTVGAFLAALAVARERHAIAAGVLVVAGLIAVSRVFLGAHWPSDVIAGALLGTTIGVVAARFARL